MSRFAVLILGVASAIAVHAASYTVAYQKSITFEVPDATAAYTIDPQIAEASADHGLVSVAGKSPGNTHVVVVTPAGVQTFEIVVPNPPPVYPKGWVAPRPEGLSNENGYYETRYSSLPQQLTNVLDFSRQGIDQSTHFYLAGTDFFPSPNNPYNSNGVSNFAITSASYSVRTPDRSVTLVDQFVDESPLTVGGAIVRGLHWQEGDWFFHGGYTSPAPFQQLFLPLRAEGVFGTGYRFKLTPHSRLIPSFYYLTMPSATHTGNAGPIASLLYAYQPSDNLRFAAEIGESRGLGGSSTLVYRGPGEILRARFRYTPDGFAALSISNFRGLYSDLNWTREWSEAFGSDLNVTNDRFDLPSFHEITINGGAQLRYRPSRHWTLFGGATYSVFHTEAQGQTPLEGIYYPAGVGFNSRFFGVNFQHQWSRYTEQNTGGHQYLASVRTGFGQFSFNGYAERETQAPTVGFLISQVNGLSQLLSEYGVTATTPQQITDFLNQNAALINLQYLNNVTINLTPVREQVSGSVTWMGRGYAPQIDYEFLFNDDQMITGSNELTIHRISARQRIGYSNDLSLTLAQYRARSTGQRPTVNPLVAVMLRHQFNAAPGFLMLERHGSIRGRVFEDLEGQGTYAANSPGVAGVEMILDDRRRTRTGADGTYQFSGVPEGVHTVRAVLHDEVVYYFTTPEQAQVNENGEANFGLARSMASLGGQVQDDVPHPVSGILVAIQGQGHRLTSVTGSNGRFLIPRLPDGEYSVFVDAESLPAGYVIEEPELVRLTTQSGKAAQANLKIRALRNVSGRVLLYDRAAGRYVGIANVKVVVKELPLSMVTGADGAFLFRELPAGLITVSAEYGGQVINKLVNVPEQPAQINDTNLVMGQR